MNFNFEDKARKILELADKTDMSKSSLIELIALNFSLIYQNGHTAGLKKAMEIIKEAKNES